MQIVVQRSGDSNLLVLGKKAYEIAKNGDRVLVNKLLSEKEQSEVLKQTKIDYTKSVLCVMFKDGTIPKKVGAAISSIKSDLKSELTKSEERFLETSITGVFKNLRKQ